MDGNELRRALLQVVAERAGSPNLQPASVVNAVAQRVKLGHGIDAEQALLTFWSDLFRSGYIAWGYNLDNANPPFCHITERGRRVLANVSRDPANPAGYIAHLKKGASLNPIAESYLVEALETFNGGHFKSAAVMIGAASESLVLHLRDALVNRISELNQPAQSKLSDWRIKTVLSAIEDSLTAKKKDMPVKLFEAFESYWPAFTQQIRAVRNDSGHPTSVAPIDEPTVHASLLIFPELARIAADLQAWLKTSYK